MSEVKRFYIMQCAVPVIVDETPAYTPMTNHKTELHTVPVVFGSVYDALQQRCRELEEQRARWASNATELGDMCDALRAEVERLRQGTLRMEIARSIAPADRWHWAVVLPSGHVFALGESFASPELCAADAALAGMNALHAARNAIKANQCAE